MFGFFESDMYLEKYCVMNIFVILIYFVNYWMYEIFEEVIKKRGLRSYNFLRYYLVKCNELD